MLKSGRWLLLGILLGSLCYWTISKRLAAVNPLATQGAQGAVSVASGALSTKAEENFSPPVERAAEARDVSQAKAVSQSKWLELLESLDQGAAWKVRRDDRGRVILVTGGMFRLPEKGIKDSIAWAKKMAEYSGVPSDQIVDTGEMLPETDASRTYHYPQMYQGFVVSGAFINVFERKDDGAIYYTAMELADIGTPDLRQNISRAQAEEIGRDRFKQYSKVEVITNPDRPVDQKPVIVQTAPGQSELAWPVVVSLDGPGHDERLVMVSAVTGDVLRDIRVLNH